MKASPTGRYRYVMAKRPPLKRLAVHYLGAIGLVALFGLLALGVAGEERDAAAAIGLVGVVVGALGTVAAGKQDQ